MKCFRGALVAAVVALSGAPAVAQQLTPCVGDCQGTGMVVVIDILQMLDIALGLSPPSICPAGDADGDGRITVDEIVSAENNLLNGCPGGML